MSDYDRSGLGRRCLLRGGASLALTTGLLGNVSKVSAAAPPATPAIALVGGELHVGDGEVIKGAVVVLEGERFAVVSGPAGRARIAERGARVVDLDGKILTPGFIAADTQLGLIEIEMEATTRDDSLAGADPVRAAYDAAAALQVESSLLQIQAIEGITSAAVAPSGGLIAGQVAWIDLVHGDRSQMLVRPRLALAGSLGQVIGGSRAATLSRLRELLADARFYRQRKGAHERGQLRQLAAHPRDLEALAPVLERRAVLTLSAQRESDILAALDLAREEGLRIAIVGGAEAWKLAPRLAEAKVPVILQPSENLPGSLDTLSARLDNAALLAAAGAEVVIGVLGSPHNLRNIRQEAGIAVANGLEWERALTAVSLGVARAYGMDQTHGSVRPGKVANVVVWDRDPFELAAAPQQVYIRGRAIPMVSRQTLLRERYRDVGREAR
ncbi:MAG: amidohydrolase family protein [Nannocystis sp.]|nr:amidohydrolase family protein [Nannocystis sp.]